MKPSDILAILRATCAQEMPRKQGIMILCAIYDGPKTDAEIAELTGIRSGSLATVTMHLKRDGLLTVDDDFRRLLTEQGRDLVEALADCTP